MRPSSSMNVWRHSTGHLLHFALILFPTILISLGSITQYDVLIFAFMIGVAGLIESILVSASRKETTDDPRALQVAAFVGAFMLVMFWTAQLERHFLSPSIWNLSAFGTVLVVCGIILRASAIHSLGPRFISDVHCDGPPVTKGIYRFMLHPSEIGMLAIAVGGPLTLQAPWTAIIAFSVLTPISYWRVLRENQVLAAAKI